MYDPRALINVLEGQGFRTTGIGQESGNLVYWITAPDGMRYGLTGQDLESLHEQGKLDLAGILEYDQMRKED